MSLIHPGGSSLFIPQSRLEPGEKGDPDDDRSPDFKIAFVLCLIALVEGMDITLIGSAQHVFFDDFPGYSLWTEGSLAIAQGVFQNMGGAFWGIVADRGWMSRNKILIFGTAIQAMCTIGLALSFQTWMLFPMRALNGFFLAGLRPISTSIVSDMTALKHQGRYFGYMQGLWNLGMSGTGIIVAANAQDPIFGYSGWRFCYIVVSTFGLMSCALCAIILPNIKSAPLTPEEASEGPCAVVVSEIKKMLTFFRMGSFNIMIGQGIFGSVPWTVLPKLTQYAYCCGFGNAAVGQLQMPGLAGAIGGNLGGLISDCLFKKIGVHARPLTAELSVLLRLPLIYTLWYGIAPMSEFQTIEIMLILQVAFYLVAPWSQPGCNFPVLGVIVTGKDRNKVICWEMAFENTAATLVGAYAVPVVQSALGLKFDYNKNLTPNMEWAVALSTGVTVTVMGCWGITGILYSGLHYTFPRDVERLEQEKKGLTSELAKF